MALRSRKEVVQHARAFQHIIKHYVHQRKPMTEELIKETHKILTEGLSIDGAGVSQDSSMILQEIADSISKDCQYEKHRRFVP